MREKPQANGRCVRDSERPLNESVGPNCSAISHKVKLLHAFLPRIRIYMRTQGLTVCTSIVNIKHTDESSSIKCDIF